MDLLMIMTNSEKTYSLNQLIADISTGLFTSLTSENEALESRAGFSCAMVLVPSSITTSSNC
ncbi:MAG: hypothetical protein HOE90_23830 [Bacteriovoracaceae bacterium]|jgi:hypothetical protein|nr:hypothetical protein [Bacteriovoracaceae bacterium]